MTFRLTPTELAQAMGLLGPLATVPTRRYRYRYTLIVGAYPGDRPAPCTPSAVAHARPDWLPRRSPKLRRVR